MYLTLTGHSSATTAALNWQSRTLDCIFDNRTPFCPSSVQSFSSSDTLSSETAAVGYTPRHAICVVESHETCCFGTANISIVIVFWSTRENIILSESKRARLVVLASEWALGHAITHFDRAAYARRDSSIPWSPSYKSTAFSCSKCTAEAPSSKKRSLCSQCHHSPSWRSHRPRCHSQPAKHQRARSQPFN